MLKRKEDAFPPLLLSGTDSCGTCLQYGRHQASKPDEGEAAEGGQQQQDEKAREHEEEEDEEKQVSQCEDMMGGP